MVIACRGQELRRLQQGYQEQQEEIQRVQDENDKLKRNGKKQRKRRRIEERTQQEQTLHKAGQLYALTKRLWLPDLDLDFDETSADNPPDRIKEYIEALPEGDREDWRDTVIISVVCIHRFHTSGDLLKLVFYLSLIPGWTPFVSIWPIASGRLQALRFLSPKSQSL